MTAAESRVRIGVSSCLLGERVRFDGGHKDSRFVSQELGAFVEFVSVCPEVEMGLSTPRPSLRLQISEEGGVRMREVESGEDHTECMARFARERVRALATLDLCGYVFKKDSPSCGVYHVKLYTETGASVRKGRGLFANALAEAMPWLPLEEEGRLEDLGVRDLFVERVFALGRLRAVFKQGWQRGEVVSFHAAHKLQLMAHSPVLYRSLGRHVAAIGGLPRAEFRAVYEAEFLAALANEVSVGRHVNVLQHMVGYFREGMAAGSRRAIGDAIGEYGSGLVPLSVPLALIRDAAERLDVDYLRGQTYLAPEAAERQLRFCA